MGPACPVVLKQCNTICILHYIKWGETEKCFSSQYCQLCRLYSTESWWM